MPAANVPMVIDQGEDWTTDIVWTDGYNDPIPVVHPCRLDVKNAQGQTIVTLSSDEDAPVDAVQEIGVFTEIGVVQLHLTRQQTASFNPGQYQYDLFVTTTDDNDFVGPQVQRILYGTVTINKRVTEL